MNPTRAMRKDEPTIASIAGYILSGQSERIQRSEITYSDLVRESVVLARAIVAETIKTSAKEWGE